MAGHVLQRIGTRPTPAPQQHLEIDRDNELLAAIRHDNLDEGAQRVIEGPAIISSDALMGKMPKADRILKKDILKKLTSSYEWKDMHVALTNAGLFMARPNEELLKDLIPLYEIAEVRKRHDLPLPEVAAPLRKDSSSNKDAGFHSTASLRVRGTLSTLSNLVDMEPDDAQMHVIQVRTTEGGYNSGRTYFFGVQSDEVCPRVRPSRPAAAPPRRSRAKTGAPLHPILRRLSRRYVLVVARRFARSG